MRPSGYLVLVLGVGRGEGTKSINCKDDEEVTHIQNGIHRIQSHTFKRVGASPSFQIRDEELLRYREVARKDKEESEEESAYVTSFCMSLQSQINSLMYIVEEL